MKKAFWLMPLLALVVSQGHCEQKFEVASITPCAPGTPAPPGEHMGMVQFVYPGGRFTARATTVKYLMEWAYGILPAQHSEGPSWLGQERYDIVAKAPGNPTEEQMKLMTQTLLEERFKLKLHRETRELPILVLSVGKTPPKLFAPKDGETHSLKVTPRTGDDGKPFSWHTAATRYSFAQLNLTFATVLDRVIVNRTGLDGEYDFEMDFTPDENRPNPLDPSLVITAMREQLGLVVKAEKGLAEYLIVEGAERVAAGN